LLNGSFIKLFFLFFLFFLAAVVK